MRIRIWPKAAILVVITIYFGLVHAEVVPGPSEGPGRTPAGRRLEAALGEFYAVPTRWAALNVGLYHDAEFVPLILVEVLRHADDTDPSVRRRNRDLIAWAQQLVMASGDGDAFTRVQIARLTARLFARYDGPSQTRANLMMILDRLDLWTDEHLPFLARRAGSTSDDEADEFGTRGLIVLDQGFEAALEPMVAEIRRQSQPRRPAQWAMLANSGRIRADELATLVMFLAHEFAFADGFVELAPSLMPDEPLRQVVERFMTGLEDQDETTHSAFLMAQDQSEDVGDEDSPRVHRRAFFRRLVEGTLFTERPEQGVEVSTPVNQNGEVARPRRTPYDLDGNIIRPHFGTKCEANLR